MVIMVCTTTVRTLCNHNNRALGLAVLHSLHIYCSVIIMPDPKLFEEVSARVAAALAATPAADIEKNLRVLIASAFAKLDLVSRDDFEIQKELLARAQTRLAALEARLAELEVQRKH